MTQKELVKLATKRMAQAANNPFINTPRVSSVEVIGFKELPGSIAYEMVKAIFTDIYTNPITGMKQTDKYVGIYEGVNNISFTEIL